ncbi:unnamed protein product [Euphydryas editha]|uniref:Uncharacterized protein n=1 Tax=Euphydryas editha TaxID=104508 RepID=A0AAU9TW14_EUPED|nr:unnamed protein product [Euphydryas editha]
MSEKWSKDVTASVESIKNIDRVYSNNGNILLAQFQFGFQIINKVAEYRLVFLINIEENDVKKTVQIEGITNCSKLCSLFEAEDLSNCINKMAGKRNFYCQLLNVRVSKTLKNKNGYEFVNYHIDFEDCSIIEWIDMKPEYRMGDAYQKNISRDNCIVKCIEIKSIIEISEKIPYQDHSFIQFLYMSMSLERKLVSLFQNEVEDNDFDSIITKINEIGTDEATIFVASDINGNQNDYLLGITFLLQPICA